MTDTNPTTIAIDRAEADRRKHLDAALSQTIAGLARFQAEHPGEDVDVPVIIVDGVIDEIFRRPITALGDCRLFARAWLERYQDELGDEEPLMRALAALPEQMWGERIG